MKVPLTFPSLSLSRGPEAWQMLLTSLQQMFQMIAGAINYPDHGLTANRPTQQLAIGQYFFDQSLGVPIWWNGSHWVNASGTQV